MVLFMLTEGVLRCHEQSFTLQRRKRETRWRLTEDRLVEAEHR
jgi:hypothetical protein